MSKQLNLAEETQQQINIQKSKTTDLILQNTKLSNQRTELTHEAQTLKNICEVNKNIAAKLDSVDQLRFEQLKLDRQLNKASIAVKQLESKHKIFLQEQDGKLTLSDLDDMLSDFQQPKIVNLEPNTQESKELVGEFISDAVEC